MVMQRVKIHHLYPDGSVQTSNGKTKSEFPNMMLTTHGGKNMGFVLIQNPVFTASKPRTMDWFLCPACKANATGAPKDVQEAHRATEAKIEASMNVHTADAVLENVPEPPPSVPATVELECMGCLMTAPPPDPDLKTTTKMIITEANNPFPLGCPAPLTNDQKHAIGQSIDEEMQQAAQNAASRDSFGYDTKRTMFLLLMAITAFLTIIFGLAMWNSLILKDDPEVVPASRSVDSWLAREVQAS